MNKHSLDEKAVYNILTDDAAYGTVLLAICYVAYPDDLFDVDSLELYLRLEEDFGAAPTDDNKNKLQALMTAVSTNFFYENLDAFKSICNSLIEGDPGIGELGMEDPTVLEILWAVYEVGLVMDDDEDDAFSPSIERYIERAIYSEAEDNDDLEVDEVVPAHEAAIVHMVTELQGQLRSIFEYVPDFPRVL